MSQIQNDMLEKIEVVNDILKSDFKEINERQQEKIQDNFNCYVSFNYLEDGGYIFLMEKETFKTFNYYLGMEYETPEILITIDKNVLVSYEYDCKRAKELFELLNEFEEE